jgi:hypothetical protein
LQHSYSASVKLCGVLNYKGFKTPKVLAYAKTRERRVGVNKSIAMRWMAIALVQVTETPKEREGKILNFKASL